MFIPTSRLTDFLLTESHAVTATSGRQGWTSRLYFKSTAPPTTFRPRVTATVACMAPPPVKVTVKQVQATSDIVTPGARKRAYASCPAGAEAVSGGYRAPNLGQLDVEGSRTVLTYSNGAWTENWDVAVFNRGSVNNARFDVYVTCLSSG